MLSQSLASTNKALVEAAARALQVQDGYKAHSALPARSPLDDNNRFVANAAAKSVAKIQEASALAQIGKIDELNTD